MSIDAKLFVCAGKEVALDLLLVVDNVISSKELGFFKGSNQMSMGWLSEVACFHLNFLYSNKAESINENRMISVVFGCDSDYSDTYEGDKVILSLGCWGSSDEIMKTLAKELAQFGDVYYDRNDCDAEGFVKLYNKGE